MLTASAVSQQRPVAGKAAGQSGSIAEYRARLASVHYRLYSSSSNSGSNSDWDICTAPCWL